MVAPTIDVGNDRQLFLDDTFFDRQQRIELVAHQPSPAEVALVSDRPWETGSGLHQSSVLEDRGTFHMWYRSDEGPPDAKANRARVCYAESSDGIYWERPNLGLIDRERSRDNNILFPDENYPLNADVIIDPNGPPSERYKMIGRSRGEGYDHIVGLVSEDGIGWREVDQNPLISDPPLDTHNILVWDDERDRYVIYCRGVGTSRPGSFRGGHRSIRRSESEDFIHWSEPETIIQADEDDPEHLHFYTIAAEKYGRAARSHFMFPMVYYPERDYPGAPFNGVSDVQLATSRDGIAWKRRFRRPLISPGLDERNWVDRNPIMGRGILQTGPNEVSMYYSEFLRSGIGNSRIRRCTFRTDGFVSVQGPYAGWGEFTTPLLTFSGAELEMNYSTSGGGSIFVELQEADGTAVPGFSLDDCDVVFGDKIEGVVRWNGSTNVG